LLHGAEVHRDAFLWEEDAHGARAKIRAVRAEDPRLRPGEEARGRQVLAMAVRATEKFAVLGVDFVRITDSEEPVVEVDDG
jgi:hypothetical protein